MDEALEILARLGLWVYPLLFVYAAAKSGYLPLAAGYFAALGALDWRFVALAAFAGAVLGDEARFHLARRFEPRLTASPRWRRPMAIAGDMLRRHGAGYIFLYRYAKGLRTIGALPIGLAGWPWGRFAVLNVASAALWTVLLVGGGYTAGESLVALFGDAGRWIGLGLLGLLALSSLVLWRISASRVPVSP